MSQIATDMKLPHFDVNIQNIDVEFAKFMSTSEILALKSMDFAVALVMVTVAHKMLPRCSKMLPRCPQDGPR